METVTAWKRLLLLPSEVVIIHKDTTASLRKYLEQQALKDKEGKGG